MRIAGKRQCKKILENALQKATRRMLVSPTGRLHKNLGLFRNRKRYFEISKRALRAMRKTLRKRKKE